MTSSRPLRLNPPALEAYHFINIMFRRDLIGMAHYPIKHYPLIANDRAFRRENFEANNLLRPEQMAPLKAMNDTTLSRLLWILKPNHFGTDISTKDRFDEEMAHFYKMHQDNYNSPPSYDQVQSFELHNSKLALHIHWGQLADLYNESTPDQQEAIHQFFVKCLNRDLEDLLATPAPEVKLPENLQKQFQAKIENGDTLFWSEIEQLWLRDDIHHQTYRAKIGYRGSADPDLVIATAPTMPQAIALSTIYVNNSNISNVGGSELTIYLHDQEFAIAKVDTIGELEPCAKVMLKWNLEKAGIVYTGLLENLRDNMVTQMETCSPGIAAGLAEDHAKFCQKIAVLSRENPQSFTKKLMAVERALGIQWSKVQILEEALGL